MKVGWKTEPLGELCDFQRGLTYAKSDEVGASKNIVLRANNINLSTNTLDFSDLKCINDSIVVPTNKKVKKGSLIICTASGSKAHLGKVAFIDDDYGYAFGGFMGMVTPKSGILPRYLFHVLTSGRYKDFIGELSDGANINNLKFDDLSRFKVPYPTRAEQQRIVAILDEAFAGIAAAKANAEKNLQNARVLFESHVQSVFTERGEGWEEKALGELATFRNGINFTKASKGDPIRIVGVRDFQSNYWVPLENLELIVPDGVVPDSDTLQENDILFVRSNGNQELIGRCLLVGKLYERTTHSGFTIKARLQTSEVLPTYVCHFLKSGRVRREMIDGGNGANIKSLNQGTLSRILIPFPPLGQQSRAVSRLEMMQDEVRRLELIYQSKVAALDELKKSLLHEAFIGQL